MPSSLELDHAHGVLFFEVLFSPNIPLCPLPPVATGTP